MRDDFCAFILTHGRPDRVYTYETLKRQGYTGKIFIVIDDEDKTADEYRRRFGDSVLMFSKQAVAATFDEGDNFNDRRAIIYARNACWTLAAQVGCRHFIQLDDDYKADMHLRFDSANRYWYYRLRTSLDDLFSALLDFYLAIPATSVAMSQGGDHLGGNSLHEMHPSLRRKAMNSFVCSVDRPFQFFGRINEDVNTYTTLGRRGALFFTVMQAQLVQLQTQSNAGGMTDLYLNSGTYVKSFYSVMYSPSCVRIGLMGDPRGGQYRMHHAINWHHTVPLILREHHRKPD
jgi:hypothetical protein